MQPKLWAEPTEPIEPEEPVKRKPRRLPHFLRKHEINQLLGAADAQLERCTHAVNHHKRIVCSVSVYRAAQQDRMIAVLGLYLGLRVSEITGLCVEHVNLIDRDVFVRGKGQVDRYIPIPARILDELRRWCAFRGSGYVLKTRRGKRMNSSTVDHRIARLGALAGFTRRLHCHVLRHSFASRLLEEGADLIEIRDLLGHASLATVQIYTHCTPAKLRSAVDRI